MKIALFIDTNRFFGTERHILELAKGLNDEKIEVSVICPHATSLAVMAKEEGLRVHTIKKNNSFNLIAIRKISSLLRLGQIDIIHAHNGRAVLMSIAAIITVGKGRCIVTQHFIKPAHTLRSFLSRLIYRSIHRWVNKKIDHFIAVSKAVYQAMIARGDAECQRISIIPHGMRIPDREKIESPSNIRRKLNVQNHVPLIVCLSRLEKEKNISLLIDAMHVVSKHISFFKCVIAGEGHQNNQLLAKVETLGLGSYINLIGFYKDVFSLINAADILVLPSSIEPFGLVLLEAMAYKKPVVATRCGGPSEIVIDGQTGLLIEPLNADDLAQAILRLLNDPKTCKSMGENGFRRFREKYTAQRMAKDTIEVYKQVMKG